MKQLNIGIIGAGRIGKVHAQSITYNVPTAKVLGITDVFKDGLQELADKYGIEKMWEAMQNYLRISNIKMHMLIQDARLLGIIKLMDIKFTKVLMIM